MIMITILHNNFSCDWELQDLIQVKRSAMQNNYSAFINNILDKSDKYYLLEGLAGRQTREIQKIQTGFLVYSMILIIQFQRQKMYIQPSEYLELTDRLEILTSRLVNLTSQNKLLQTANIALHSKLDLLQARVVELENEKIEKKEDLKEHITKKTQHIVDHISVTKDNQKKIVLGEIDKIRNWSAIQILKKLDERIAENRTVTYEKQFYQKIKTLYIINKNVSKCTSDDVFKWVKSIVDNKTEETNNQANANENKCPPSQKSMKKSQKSVKSKASTKSIFETILNTATNPKKKQEGKQGSERKNMIGSEKNELHSIVQQSQQQEMGTPSRPVQVLMI